MVFFKYSERLSYKSLYFDPELILGLECGIFDFLKVEFKIMQFVNNCRATGNQFQTCKDHERVISELFVKIVAIWPRVNFELLIGYT